MEKKKQYVPFGDEWIAEVKKLNKTVLIDFLRKTLIELKELKDKTEK